MYNLELFLDKNFELFDSILEKNVLPNINFLRNNQTCYTFYLSEKDTDIIKLADIITEFIIDTYEKNIIKKILCNDYPYFSTSEKDTIISKALNLLHAENNDIVKILISLKRRFLIKQSVLNFLSGNSTMNLSGFIHFRLTEYKKLLSELIEKVINDFKLQNEYKEFIAMLKFFVDTQKNRAPKLHIIFEKNGEYTLLNEYNKNITTECFKDFIKEKQTHSLSNEDLLISSLITLAPKKLIIHLATPHYNKKILSTIEQIFVNKVTLDEAMPCLGLVTN